MRHVNNLNFENHSAIAIHEHNYPDVNIMVASPTTMAGLDRFSLVNPAMIPPSVLMSETVPPVYDPSLKVVWVPFDVKGAHSFGDGFGVGPQGPMFSEPGSQQLFVHGTSDYMSAAYSSTVATADSWGVNIDPSLQPRQTRSQTNTVNAIADINTSSMTLRSSTLKTRSVKPTHKQTPTKIQPFNEKDYKHIPRLCKQTSDKVWKCLFQGPGSRKSRNTRTLRTSRASGCGAILHGTRLLQRHIGVHARVEEKLIKEGKLLPEEAVAIPRQVLMEYECEDPDCGYLRENGRPFRYVSYRVDGRKARHIREYH